MKALIQITAIFMCVLHWRAEELGIAKLCWDDDTTSKMLSLSIHSQRNETGKWLTSFTALRESDNTSIPSNITVDVAHNVNDCEGRTRIRITGIFAETGQVSTLKHKVGKLRFDPKCGTNVAVVNNGQSAQKINHPLMDDELFEVRLDKKSSKFKMSLGIGAIKFRPLMDDELFEVRLDKKNSKFKMSLGIGATTHSPKDITIADLITNLPYPTWGYYHGRFYHNGSVAMNNYGRDTNALVVGDRVGVMRSSAGNLHFYVNGVDQGPVASNVPSTIYGVLDLHNDAAMVTITNP